MARHGIRITIVIEPMGANGRDPADGRAGLDGTVAVDADFDADPRLVRRAEELGRAATERLTLDLTPTFAATLGVAVSPDGPVCEWGSPIRTLVPADAPAAGDLFVRLRDDIDEVARGRRPHLELHRAHEGRVQSIEDFMRHRRDGGR